MTVKPLGNSDAILETIGQTLEGFSPLKREVFVRGHYQGKTTPQIARELGLTVDEVRKLKDETDRELMNHLRMLRSPECCA